jgi:hypothetical protein
MFAQLKTNLAAGSAPSNRADWKVMHPVIPTITGKCAGRRYQLACANEQECTFVLHNSARTVVDLLLTGGTPQLSTVCTPCKHRC